MQWVLEICKKNKKERRSLPLKMTKMPDCYACVVVQITHITGTNVFLGIVNHTCETATAFCPCSMVGTLASSSFLRCPQSCWWLFWHISSRCSKTTARTLHIFLSHQMQRSSSAFCSMRWLHNVSTSVPKNEAMEIVTTFLLRTGNAE